MKTMKRVKITEEQYSGFLKQYEKNNTAQELSNMRHNVADLKQNELKVIARDAITKAFQLGADYESTSMLDMEGRKEILQKLNQLQTKIDSVN
jgi:hypothetical protein